MLDSWERLLRSGAPAPRPVRDGRPVLLYHTAFLRPDDGWSILARLNARAMVMGGVDVRLVTWGERPGPVDPEIAAEVEPLMRSARDWDLGLLSLPLSGWEYMRGVLSTFGDQAFLAMFERDHVEPELAAALGRLRGVVVQCSANRDVLQRAGLGNVTLVPCPYFDDDPHLALAPPRECRRFLWIGRDEPRKNPAGLVRAFSAAFRPGEASLTLKLSAYPHTRPTEPLEDLISELGVGGVTIVRGRLSRAEMLRLVADHDCYVSASRGEGLELGAWAMKLAGRVLVVTDSGGPRDFVAEGDVLVPRTGVVPADPSYRWWGPGATYADYRLDDLAAALQAVRGRRVAGSRVGSRHRAAEVGRAWGQWAGWVTGC